MTSKEIIKRVMEFNMPPRIGLDFNEPNQKDMAWIPSARLINSDYDKYTAWGYYKEILDKVPGFSGQVRCNAYGGIFGRLDEKTVNGECIKGSLQDGWEHFDSYELPEYDDTYEKELMKIINKNSGRFLVGVLPISVFSVLRDVRRIDNALMDVILEEEMVVKFLGKIQELGIKLIEKAHASGFDSVMVYDDWGTQRELLINPIHWRRIFKPVYAALAAMAHQRGMKFIVHSCGYVYEIINDFIEAGVDVLQFDQPGLVGVEKLADEFGGRVTFWSPVDIQKVMMTGNRDEIQAEARKMLRHFGRFNGGFIAKDYPTWEDIDVKDEWADWARKVFMEEGKI